MESWIARRHQGLGMGPLRDKSPWRRNRAPYIYSPPHDVVVAFQFQVVRHRYPVMRLSGHGRMNLGQGKMQRSRCAARTCQDSLPLIGSSPPNENTITRHEYHQDHTAFAIFLSSLSRILFSHPSMENRGERSGRPADGPEYYHRRVPLASSFSKVKKEKTKIFLYWTLQEEG